LALGVAKAKQLQMCTNIEIFMEPAQTHELTVEENTTSNAFQ